MLLYSWVVAPAVLKNSILVGCRKYVSRISCNLQGKSCEFRGREDVRAGQTMMAKVM